MRILFCFVGGPGHFEPMAPVARAAQESGHTVAVACRSLLVPIVEAAGFTALGVGPTALTDAPKRLPLLEVDPVREERDARERFADRATRARLRADGVLPLAVDWRPDVMVADEMDFGSLIVAELLGLPYATVLVIAAGSLIRAEVVAATLDTVRREHGLPPDPGLEAAGRYLVLSPFPPSLRDPAYPLPPTAHFFRPLDPAAAVPAAQRPWAPQVGRPGIYFTLGTEFNVESGDLFTRVLAGLRELPADVLVTVGRQIDPGELGPQPANVHIARYIPQGQILPHCDVVVSHGGSGTVTGALAYGLPMVLLAMGADQPANASRCQALGLGVSLDPVRATPGEVGAAVTDVLADPAYRRAAQRVQAEMASQPGPDTAVTLLERLAVLRRPLFADPATR